MIELTCDRCGKDLIKTREAFVTMTKKTQEAAEVIDVCITCYKKALANPPKKKFPGGSITSK